MPVKADASPDCRTLNISVVKLWPWTTFDVSPTGEVKEIDGALSLIVEFFKKLSKTCVRFFQPEDKHWGNPLPNGSFTGSIGALHRNECQISPGPMILTLSRFKVVDFTTMYHSGTVAILEGLNWKTEEPGLKFSFLLAFEKQVWVSIFIAFLAVAIVAALIQLTLQKTKPLRKALWRLFGGYSLIMFGTLLGKCPPMGQFYKTWSPARWQNVLILIITDFVSAILMWSFAGQILSTLVIKSPLDHVDSFEAFSRFPKVYPLLLRGSIVLNHFKDSDFEHLKYVWKRNQEKPTNYVTFAELHSNVTRDRVRKGTQAFIQVKSIIFGAIVESWRPATPHSFILTDSDYETAFCVPFVRGLDPFISKSLRKSAITVTESGFIIKMMSDLWGVTERHCVEGKGLRPESSFEQLQLYQLSGAFLLLGAGLLVSFFAFLLCELPNRRSRKKEGTEVKNVRVKNRNRKFE